MTRGTLCRKEMTEDQVFCFDLVCDLMGGEHHTASVFAWGRGIKTSFYAGQLSTFDFDYLTRLVVMAHDRCVRAEIVPSGPGRVGVVLHRRHTREGEAVKRHPTIEVAILHIRRGKDFA